MRTLTIGLLFAAGLSAGAFTNGSFEIGGVAGQIQALATSDSSVSGWLNTATVSGQENWECAPNADLSAAADGMCWVGFGNHGQNGGTLQQTFDTTAGVTYLVDYSLITQQGTAAQANTVAAYNGVNLLAGVDNSIQNTNWFSGIQLSFVATGPSTTLVFTDTTIPANVSLANWGLDAVSVTAQAPEPATACMLLGGAVALVLHRRLQKRARQRSQPLH